MNKLNSVFKRSIQNINMDISMLNFVKLGKDWNCENVCSPFTRIYMPTDGTGTLKIGTETVMLKKGNIYIVPSMLTFSYNCDDFLEKIFFHVTLTNSDSLDMLSGIGKCLILENKEKQINEIYDMLSEETLSSAFEIKSRIYRIISEGLQKYNISLGKAEEYSDTTKKAIDFIKKNLSATLTIDEIAERLFVSKLTLHTVFKRDIKMTIGKYIDKCVLIEGEKMLSSTTLSIKEISDSLGFCDQFYFSRKFSTKYGLSPQKYRKIHSI